MNFEQNREFGKKFKAKHLEGLKFIFPPVSDIIIVEYFGKHNNHHMWKNLSQQFLAHYEREIELLEEIIEKVA